MGLQENIVAPRSEMTGTQCIRRSFAIVRLLAGCGQEGQKLVDIAGSVGLAHPTAHRILKALEDEGMVERAEGSQRYRLAAEAAWLGVEPFNRCPITRLAAPFLDDLSRRGGDGVVLSVPSHNDSVYADRRLGARPALMRRAAIGTRHPLGVGIGGRVMMAFLGAARAETALRDNAARYGDWGCDADRIRDSLSEARARGYLLADSALMRECRVLAVPVRDVLGRAVGAISLVGPRAPQFEQRVTAMLPHLRHAAQEVGAALHQQRLTA